jgi:hypothetical protein
MLNEKITKPAVLGSISILIGTILIGVFGDHKSPSLTTHQLIQYFESLSFIVWISVLIGIGIILEVGYHLANWYLEKRKRMLNIDGGVTINDGDDSEILLDSPLLANSNNVVIDHEAKYQSVLAFIFCFTSSIIGVQTPILGKSMSLLLRDTISGNNQFNTPYPYILGALFLVLGAIWLWRYNVALKRYNILYVMPVITACYIVLNIVGGGIYFQEFDNFHVVEWVVFSIGGCFVIGGIFLVSMHGTGKG